VLHHGKIVFNKHSNGGKIKNQQQKFLKKKKD
jgi:hypothetical protein